MNLAFMEIIMFLQLAVSLYLTHFPILAPNKSIQLSGLLSS